MKVFRMETLKIGIIGASRVASYAMMAPSKIVPDVTVTAIAARDSKRALNFAKQHGIERAYDTYARLLADPNVNLVYISTPPNTHAQLALDAIAAGKHVLVEKPFAMSVEEACRVHDAGIAAGVKVFEAMHSPHHKLFDRVLDIVHSGEIGNVRKLSASFDAPIGKDDPFRWDAVLGGGALMDLGVYPLAWARRIGGENFEVVAANAVLRYGVDASFTAALCFDNGIHCTISSSMDALLASAFLKIEGDKGVIEVLNPLAPQMGHFLQVTSAAATRDEHTDGPSTYEAQLTAVRDACLGRGFYPFTNVDYIDSMAGIEKIRAAFDA